MCLDLRNACGKKMFYLIFSITSQNIILQYFLSEKISIMPYTMAVPPCKRREKQSQLKFYFFRRLNRPIFFKSVKT